MPAAAPVLAVSHGCSVATARDVGPFRVSDASFPPRLELATHRHERDLVSIVVDGAVQEDSELGSFTLAAATAVAIPAGVAHRDSFRDSGARTVTVEVDANRRGARRLLRALFDRVRIVGAPDLPELAQKLAGELRATDAAAPVAIEGLALELLATASRQPLAPIPCSPPSWLAAVEEVVRNSYRTRLPLTDLAAAVNVHPAHLARVFRAHHGTSLAVYIRRLRVEWAAQELAVGQRPLAALAVDAGFADQSHFTHAFRRHTGMTPGRYRALAQAAAATQARSFADAPRLSYERRREEVPPVLLWK